MTLQEIRQVDIILKKSMFITFDHRIMCIYLNIICLKQNPIYLVATFIFLGVILTNKNHTVARY